jgi:GR25 family glycosyltransferase involved in LPS biosynthesis
MRRYARIKKTNTKKMENIKKVFYINLDSRSDRRAQINAELEAYGITAERFPAIVDTPANVGCFRSHLEVLKTARAHNYENVAIFEDDFMFLVDKPTFEAQLRAFFELNIRWDVLMLSYNVLRSEPYNELVSYGRNVQTASGYIVHRRFYDRLIANLEDALPNLIRTQRHWFYMNDACWKLLQPCSEWFFFNMRIGKQRPSYSDLEKKEVDYGV